MDFYLYEYSINNVTLTLDTNYNFNDGTIVYLNIINDYDKRKLPIIQAGIELDRSMIQKIYKYKDTAKIKFDIFEHKINHAKEVINTSLYLRHSFNIIPAFTETKYKISTDTTTEENMDQIRSYQYFEMYLIDMDAVNWFNKQLSGIFKDSSVPSVLEALLYMRNIPAKVTMATPTLLNNVQKYIILPLGNLVDNINYLNTVYGMYSAFPTIYYDLKNLYCVDRIKPNIISPVNTEYDNITFMLKNLVNNESRIEGASDDMLTKTHIINVPGQPVISDYTAKDTSTKFATITSVDENGNIRKNTIDDSSTALSYVFEYNSLTRDQIQNERMGGHRVILDIPGISVSFLKPYKTFTFNADTEYNNLNLTGHIYRVSQWSVSIHRKGLNQYSHEVNIVLYNPNRNN